MSFSYDFDDSVEEPTIEFPLTYPISSPSPVEAIDGGTPRSVSLSTDTFTGSVVSLGYPSCGCGRTRSSRRPSRFICLSPPALSYEEIITSFIHEVGTTRGQTPPSLPHVFVTCSSMLKAGCDGLKSIARHGTLCIARRTYDMLSDTANSNALEGTEPSVEMRACQKIMELIGKLLDDTSNYSVRLQLLEEGVAHSDCSESDAIVQFASPFLLTDVTVMALSEDTNDRLTLTADLLSVNVMSYAQFQRTVPRINGMTQRTDESVAFNLDEL